MKIGLTTTSFRWDQGAERFVINFARGLLQDGHEVHVIGRLEKMNAYQQFIDSLDNSDQQRFHFHQVKTIKATKYLNLVTFAGAVHQHLRQLDLDIVQGFGKSLGMDVFRPPTGTQKAFLLNLKKTPKPEPCTYQELAIEKRIIYEGAKTIVVNSHLSLKRVTDVYPGIKIPIEVIPNMVDFNYWNPELFKGTREKLRKEWGIPDNGIVFLHVSTAFKTKGVIESLEALKILRDKLPASEMERIYFVLVGDSNFKLPDDISEDKVKIFPRTNEIRPFYFASDVLLHATHFDSYSNVVLEGLTCSMPVITSAQNGAMEAITDDVDGLIIREVDPQLIADAVSALLDDQKRNTMKAAAKEKSLQFSPQQITHQYVDLYRKLIDHSPRSTHDLSIKPFYFLNNNLRKDFQHYLSMKKQS